MDPYLLDPSLLSLNGDEQSMINQNDFQQSYQNPDPIQRFVNERQRNYFTAPAPDGPSQLYNSLSQASAPVGSMPSHRMASPALSYGLQTATSASSPRTDAFNDFSGSIHHDGFMSNSQDYYDQQYLHSSGYMSDQNMFFDGRQQSTHDNGVNLSEVQGFADPQEVNFSNDENYEDAIRNEYEQKSTFNSHATFQYQPRDQVISAYQYQVRHAEEDGPANYTNPNQEQPKAEIILNGHPIYFDEDEDEVAAPSPAPTAQSDTDYNPRRSSKKRKSPATARQTPKRIRTTKALRNMAPTIRSKSTTSSSHTQTHPRTFACPFNFAGCTAAFPSKNEWKRHTTTQHLNFKEWVCTSGDCHVLKNGVSSGASFNRKDLYTQHMRRMHTPAGCKGDEAASQEWEACLKGLQVSSVRDKRQQPARLGCPIKGCREEWSEGDVWDQRMEHVAQKHMGVRKDGGRDPADHGGDEMFVNWAEEEGIIEHVEGEWKLVGAGGDAGPVKESSRRRVKVERGQVYAEEDADGEEDI